MQPGRPAPYFARDGGFEEVDICDVGNRRQPGEDVGEFARECLGRSVACGAFLTPGGRRQLTNFFHQPHERAGDTRGLILFNRPIVRMSCCRSLSPIFAEVPSVMKSYPLRVDRVFWSLKLRSTGRLARSATFRGVVVLLSVGENVETVAILSYCDG